MADVQYQRLTRGRLRSKFAVAVASRSSLWLGPDHLLVVDTNGYTETYKRFYFRDIQSFTFALSKNRLVWNWVLGVLTAISIMSWAAYFPSNGVGITSALLAFFNIAIFALPLLINNLLGPTCTCHIRTAVQTEELCPLNRLGRVRRVLDRVRPLILAAQGPAPAGAAAPVPAQPANPAPASSSGESPVAEPGDVPPQIVS